MVTLAFEMLEKANKKAANPGVLLFFDNLVCILRFQASCGYPWGWRSCLP